MFCIWIVILIALANHLTVPPTAWALVGARIVVDILYILRKSLKKRI